MVSIPNDISIATGVYTRKDSRTISQPETWQYSTLHYFMSHIYLGLSLTQEQQGRTRGRECAQNRGVKKDWQTASCPIMTL